MNKKHIELIARQLHIREWQAEHAVTLMEDGATIPFVSRYRKEATGSLDEVQLAAVKTLWNNYTELEKRRAAILKSIEEQDKLTPELKKEIEDCWQMNRLEDLYLPYRPKRKTKASIAREKGLEPLAEAVMRLDKQDCMELARRFVKEGVETAEEALAGARDIIAETVSENATLRDRIRNTYMQKGVLISKVQKGKEEEGIKYRNYFDYNEQIRVMAPHRLLALLRAHKEGVVSLSLKPHPEDTVPQEMEKVFLAKKETILAQLEAFDPSSAKDLQGALRDFQASWNQIGFVPIKDKDTIQNQYKNLINKHFGHLNPGFSEKRGNIRQGKRRISESHSEHDKLIQRFRQLESEITVWENNMGFFAKSKNADKIIADTCKKIEDAKSELKELEVKIKQIENNE